MRKEECINCYFYREYIYKCDESGDWSIIEPDEAGYCKIKPKPIKKYQEEWCGEWKSK